MSMKMLKKSFKFSSSGFGKKKKPIKFVHYLKINILKVDFENNVFIY